MQWAGNKYQTQKKKDSQFDNQLPWQDYQCHGPHSKIHVHDVHGHPCLINFNKNEVNSNIWTQQKNIVEVIPNKIIYAG